MSLQAVRITLREPKNAPVDAAFDTLESTLTSPNMSATVLLARAPTTPAIVSESNIATKETPVSGIVARFSSSIPLTKYSSVVVIEPEVEAVVDVVAEGTWGITIAFVYNGDDVTIEEARRKLNTFVLNEALIEEGGGLSCKVMQGWRHA